MLDEIVCTAGATNLGQIQMYTDSVLLGMLTNPEKFFRICKNTAENVRDLASSLFEMEGATKCAKVADVDKSFN